MLLTLEVLVGSLRLAEGEHLVDDGPQVPAGERPVETAKLVQKTVQSTPVIEVKKQDKKDPSVRERKVLTITSGK